MKEINVESVVFMTLILGLRPKQGHENVWAENAT